MVGSGSCETHEFRKMDSITRLSITELEKLAEAGIELKQELNVSFLTKNS